MSSESGGLGGYSTAAEEPYEMQGDPELIPQEAYPIQNGWNRPYTLYEPQEQTIQLEEQSQMHPDGTMDMMEPYGYADMEMNHGDGGWEAEMWPVVEAQDGQLPTTSQWTAPEQLEQAEINLFENVEHAHCMDCDEMVEVKMAKQHIINCHVSKDYNCSDCHMEFNREANFRLHRMIEHDAVLTSTAPTDSTPKKYTCSFTRDCSKTFARKSSYMAHLKQHMVSECLTCNVCQEELANGMELRRHRRLHMVAEARESVRTEMLTRGQQLDEQDTFLPDELVVCAQCERVLPCEETKMHRQLHIYDIKFSQKKERRKRKREGKTTEETEQAAPAAAAAPLTLPPIQLPALSDDMNEAIGADVVGLALPPPDPTPPVAHPAKEAKKGGQKKCDECGKEFKRPAELRRHMVVHTKERKFKCESCDKEFRFEAAMKEHAKKVHNMNGGANVIYCMICKNEFKSKFNLERHVLSVHRLSGPRPGDLACPHCPCTFASAGAMSMHIISKHNIKNASDYRCPQCPMSFSKRVWLERHIRSHTKQRPYKCTRCYSSFNLKCNLNKHMLIHTREDIADPYISRSHCPECFKQLSSKEALRKHMLIHSSIAYKCNGCLKKFSTFPRLDRHLSTCASSLPHDNGQIDLLELAPIGTGEQMGGADGGVASEMPTAEELHMHVYQDRRFMPPSQRHYVCQICNCAFAVYRNYKEHLNQHSGLRPHLCYICHKSFRTAQTLAIHRQVHDLMAPVACDFCPLAFSTRARQRNHMRLSHGDRAGDMVGLPLEPADRTLAASSQSFPELTGRELAEGLFAGRALSAHPPEIGEGGGGGGGAAQFVVPDTRQPVRCQVCIHLFHSATDLACHLRNCVNDPQHFSASFQCDMCGEMALGSEAAALHIETHHPPLSALRQAPPPTAPPPPPTRHNRQISQTSYGRLQYVCSECDYTAPKRSDVVKHIRIHTGERPFGCDICSRAFTSNSNLLAHKNSHHLNEPQHECQVCSGRYYSASALKIHMRSHTGEKPLHCPHCPAAFSTSDSRRRHVRRHTDEERQRVRGEGQPHAQPALDIVPLPPQQACDQPGFAETVAQISRPSRKGAGARVGGAGGSAFAAPAKQPLSHASQHVSTRVGFVVRQSDGDAHLFNVWIVESPPPPGASVSSSEADVWIEKAMLEQAAANAAVLSVPLPDRPVLTVRAGRLLSTLQRGAPFPPLRLRIGDVDETSGVQLLPPFITRCSICEVDLATREASDAHMASEDHETAQLLTPLTSVQNGARGATTEGDAGPQPFTCKLCGNRYVDMAMLVGHIRRDHERDHPTSLAPRHTTRTAPIH